MKKTPLALIWELVLIVPFCCNIPVFGMGVSVPYGDLYIYPGETKTVGYYVSISPSEDPTTVRHTTGGDANIASLPGGAAYIDYDLQPGTEIYTPTIITIPSELLPGEYYVSSHWQAIGGNSNTVGLTVHVNPEPEILIIAPNGGEILTEGTYYKIRWSNTEPIDNIQIEYSTNNGESWNTIINNMPNTNSYNWIVPSINSNQCLIRVSDTIGPSINGISQNLFTIIPRNSYYGGGSGSELDPYLIYTADDINEIGKYPVDWDKHFKLMADIDFSEYTFTTAVIAPDWDNISEGFQGIAFTGTFNGNGYVIHHFTIDTNGVGNDFLGLFGCTASACEIRNLDIEDVSITGGNSSWYAGGLVGLSQLSTIINCHARGSITSGDNSRNLGGLVGSIGENEISNCSAKVSVMSGNSSSVLGGLVGYNYGSLNNCYATGSVTSGDNSYHLGGLTGVSQTGEVNNCYATGTITGGESSGYIGGLVGSNFGSGFISNSYATGLVTTGNYSWPVGGLVGYNSYGTINNCFWDTQTSERGYGWGYSEYGIIANVLGKTTTEMKTQTTFTNMGWDFIEIWDIGENQTYPYLRIYSVGDLNHDKNVDFYDFAIFANHWLESF